MKFLDLSLPTPAENLAADEALLEAAEAGDCGPILRFWESPISFVTLGYTNRAATEANLAACEAAGVPVLRRVSGGGTVLQGPGCLNYALIHPIPNGESLNVEATNCMVMKTNQRAFKAATGQDVEMAGHTDLAIEGRKFSGNAQRRKSKFFLFHGTALIDFDLKRVQSLLRPPSKEPDYRAQRSHLDFITNINATREQVKAALCEAWGATEATSFYPAKRVQELIEEKYSHDEWNLKF